MVPGRTPLIGVTTYRQQAVWGPWQRSAALLPTSYVDCVAAAGGRPLLLPPSEGPGGDDLSATDVVAVLDGLVLVGGGDVDPACYGAVPDPATAGVNRARDDSELALLSAALQVDLPVLAICRGMQLLNVRLGGTLVQHVPDLVGHGGHQPAAGCFGPTRVRFEPGSVVSKTMGEVATVACSHHQAIDTLADGLVVTARAPDGLIEAVELPAARFAVAVQWHPEQDADLRLFDALVGGLA
ncbi:MAG TPA: gamma-glutamyl-gamma-aminobutyrate hydrolase family protein [Acidimicrobiales bacterium]|nr:gamma-glutamyl-gamma-aminobutyrate hydrolase family protein [Acidimicrobiales bacterium]